MADPIFIGIDLGTTVLKLCAIDSRTGRILAQTSRRLRIDTYPEGGREIKLAGLDRVFQASIRSLKSSLGSAWNQVAGIGLSSQAGSSILADRETGIPHTPMILWNDGRSYQYLRRLSEFMPDVDMFWNRYLLSDSPPAGLGRLLWFKEIYRDLFHPGTIHIGAGEYLFFQLARVWRQDAGNAFQIGSYNAMGKKLFTTFFDPLKIPLSFVAPLRDGHETAPLSPQAAQRFDLPEGIPVAGPYFDQEASFLSASGACKHPLQVSLGTAWVGNFIVPENYEGMSSTQIVVPSPLDEGRLVVQPLLTGNPAWEWGLRQFVDPSLSRALSLAKPIFQKSILPPPGLVAIPWMSQINPFNPETHGGGLFVGIGDQTESDDLLRALAAGMAFELARVFQVVKDIQIVDGIVLGGGASQGMHFCQLIAALFSPIPVYRQTDVDYSAARGSLFAFRNSLAHSDTETVPLTEKKRMGDLLDRWEEYNDVFQSLYSSYSFCQPYQLKRNYRVRPMSELTKKRLIRIRNHKGIDSVGSGSVS